MLKSPIAMAKAVKLDFLSLRPLADGTSAPQAPANVKRVLTGKQISEIRAAAHAEGLIAGRLAAIENGELICAARVNEIVEQHEAILAQVDAHIFALRAQSAELAIAVAKCFAPALIAREPYAEIEALFNACVASLITEPRIVIRVEETLVEQLKSRIESAAQKAAYQGRVVIIGNSDSDAGQCRIEWADGGVAANSSEVLAEIEQRVARYLSTPRPHTTPGDLTKGLDQ